MNHFPQAPEYPIRAFFKFFENLRTYLQLRVHQRFVDTGGALSAQLFQKILNEPNVIFRGLGEDDSGKKPEQKIW
jgi:hypothetical protein